MTLHQSSTSRPQPGGFSPPISGAVLSSTSARVFPFGFRGQSIFVSLRNRRFEARQIIEPSSECLRIGPTRADDREITLQRKRKTRITPTFAGHRFPSMDDRSSKVIASPLAIEALGMTTRLFRISHIPCLIDESAKLPNRDFGASYPKLVRDLHFAGHLSFV